MDYRSSIAHGVNFCRTVSNLAITAAWFPMVLLAPLSTVAAQEMQPSIEVNFEALDNIIDNGVDPFSPKPLSTPQVQQNTAPIPDQKPVTAQVTDKKPLIYVDPNPDQILRLPPPVQQQDAKPNVNAVQSKPVVAKPEATKKTESVKKEVKKPSATDKKNAESKEEKPKKTTKDVVKEVKKEAAKEVKAAESKVENKKEEEIKPLPVTKLKVVSLGEEETAAPVAPAPVAEAPALPTPPAKDLKVEAPKAEPTPPPAPVPPAPVAAVPEVPVLPSPPAKDLKVEAPKVEPTPPPAPVPPAPVAAVPEVPVLPSPPAKDLKVEAPKVEPTPPPAPVPPAPVAAVPEVPVLPSPPAKELKVEAPKSEPTPAQEVKPEETAGIPADDVPVEELPIVKAKPEDAAVDSSAEEPKQASVSGGQTDYTIVFKSTETDLPLSVADDLKDMAGRIKSGNKRVILKAYASESADQSTSARRVSLSRVLAVRAFLIENGVDKMSINVQAEGSKNPGGEPDRVDFFLSDKK